ncbi:MAG: ABC transporter substrate-binding protein [Actinomycetota bacterium]|jgi:peptide/nickel transport system substrate-binding protein|nr:ABC transporter substrate-binding protein [Actinomycetota bacterium]
MTQGSPLSRRSFLTRSAGGAVALGLGGPTLLAACSQSATSSSSAHVADVFAQGSVGIGKGSARRGGSVTVGTDAEIDGFYPPSNHWDNNGFLYANAVYDPLTAIAEDGTAQPYLAESVTPNASSTVWTITLRPNITFHDGSPLTASVVKNNLDALIASPLTGQALNFISSVQATGPLTVTVTMNQPIVSFAYALAVQTGYVVGQAMLDAVKANPNVAPHPVGTGPFVYQVWQPNSHFTATRNPHYWRPGYPYLDSITFKPIPDTNSREQTLRTGGVDLIVSRNPGTVDRFKSDPSYQVVDSLMFPQGEPDMDFIMLNCIKPPTNDLSVRQALAKGIDQVEIQKLFGGGFAQPANGLFPKGSKYYSDTGYPTFDPKGAKALVSAYSKVHGPLAVNLVTIPDPRDVRVVQIIQQMWDEVGVKTSVNEIEEAELISNAITGNFEAYTFELFSAPDPDLNYVWWSTQTVAPVGGIALNFARNSDPVIQQALIRGRSTTDEAVRIEAYKTVNERLAKDLPYLWLGQTVWSAVGDQRVQNFAGPVLPNGQKGKPFDNGTFFPTQIWVD